ncbi:MAG: hypothetical protein WC892_06160 [Patescibacteria group bacterium]
MPITLLIIDDEMPVSKGYDQIEQAFPGVFKIFRATQYEVSGGQHIEGRDDGIACELLQTWAFDVILLDVSLGEEKMGPEIAAEIRSLAAFLPANRDAYLIGVSKNWDGPNRRIVSRRLQRLGLEVRGLDAAVTGDAADLIQALKHFLDKRPGA